jgi:hypothetical protein
MPDNEIVTDFADGLRIQRRPDVALDTVLEQIRTLGEILKASRKAETLRVGEWIVKRSRGEGGLGILKHTFQRDRYRQGWHAALHLEARGVPVPRPLAFIERARLGVILGNVLCTEYLDGCVDVEAFADGMIREGVEEAVVQGYLERIAEVVNLLCASGAYHNDLAGKNILTPDGERFFFIDLDGIVLDRPYTDALRLKNHVQLYDSFIDKWDDALLVPFIRQMLPDPEDIDAWMMRVRSAQAVRRARTEAIWRRQGKLV